MVIVFESFILPFQTCDLDKDDKLIPTELQACLTTDENLNYFSDITEAENLLPSLD